MVRNMDSEVLRVELRAYIDNATDEELGKMYAMIEGSERYEWWNDEEFVAELERRSADLKSGKDKGVTWEEVKGRLLSKHKQDGQ
jgi:Putative addiction module component